MLDTTQAHCAQDSKKPYFVVRFPDHPPKKVSGRMAWALERLVQAGDQGVTTLEEPAPRWSHYIYQLRGIGIDVETEHRIPRRPIRRTPRPIPARYAPRNRTGGSMNQLALIPVSSECQQQTVIARQSEILIAWSENDGFTLTQKNWPDEDAVIWVGPEYCEIFLDKICDAFGICSVP